MSTHLFANIVTPFGTAANNRGETDGNITTLQKLVWHGTTHTTVSAEAIRFALRQLLEDTNRTWDEDTRTNVWQDHEFSGWKKPGAATHIDDDLLGFMTATAAKEENTKGSANVRRSPLEITRAVSLTPWSGEVTFNAAAPGATPSAAKKGSNPVPYGAEIHATRYQFGLALTPDRLRDASRAAIALRALVALRKVAGNHGRFLFDFAPDSIVLRITDDPAPRLLYCFETQDGGKTVSAAELVRKVKAGDILPTELILGGPISEDPAIKELGIPAGQLLPGVRAAADVAIAQLPAATP